MNRQWQFRKTIKGLQLRLRWWKFRHAVRALPRAIKSFWERGRRGWATEDYWNLDDYITRVLGESLLYFEGHTNGHPNGMSNHEWRMLLFEIGTALKEYESRWQSPEGLSVEEAREDSDLKADRAKQALHTFADNLEAMWD